MLDDCADTTKSGLEGREPVGRLLRDIQKYLYTIHPPLYHLCGSLETSTLGFNRRCSLEPEPPRKGFGMSFVLFSVRDFER